MASFVCLISILFLQLLQSCSHYYIHFIPCILFVRLIFKSLHLMKLNRMPQCQSGIYDTDTKSNKLISFTGTKAQIKVSHFALKKISILQLPDFASTVFSHLLIGCHSLCACFSIAKAEVQHILHLGLDEVLEIAIDIMCI